MHHDAIRLTFFLILTILTIYRFFYGQEQVSSRAPTFENCYIPQADMEEPEGSRASTLGVYYSTQQTIQGVGALL